jgi:hypothetical protein
LSNRSRTRALSLPSDDETTFKFVLWLRLMPAFRPRRKLFVACMWKRPARKLSPGRKPKVMLIGSSSPPMRRFTWPSVLMR